MLCFVARGGGSRACCCPRAHIPLAEALAQVRHILNRASCADPLSADAGDRHLLPQGGHMPAWRRSAKSQHACARVLRLGWSVCKREESGWVIVDGQGGRRGDSIISCIMHHVAHHPSAALPVSSKTPACSESLPTHHAVTVSQHGSREQAGARLAHRWASRCPTRLPPFIDRPWALERTERRHGRPCFRSWATSM